MTDPFKQYQQSMQSQELAAQPTVSTAPKKSKAVPISKLQENEQIIRVRDFLSKTLDSTNDDGEPDLRKIVYNGTYNMGAAAIELAGLVMQEKLKLESLVRRHREKKARVLERLHNTRMGWAPSNAEVNILAEGNTETGIDGDTDEERGMDRTSLSELQSKIDRQQEYIEFLKAAQEQIRYYPRNAKALVDAYQFGVEIGKIIPADDEWKPYNKK